MCMHYYTTHNQPISFMIEPGGIHCFGFKMKLVLVSCSLYREEKKINKSTNNKCHGE